MCIITTTIKENFRKLIRRGSTPIFIFKYDASEADGIITCKEQNVIVLDANKDSLFNALIRVKYTLEEESNITNSYLVNNENDENYSTYLEWRKYCEEAVCSLDEYSAQFALDEQKKSLKTTHQVDKLSLLLASISVEAPTDGSVNDDGTVNLPIKIGYKWTPIYDASASKVSYQLVEDADAYGTADNPITFAVDMPLIPNAYYTKDSVRKVYMGEEGTVEDETVWSDETRFVEF